MSTATLESNTSSKSVPQSIPPRRPHTMVWFELPVRNLDRAKAFYETVFATQLKVDPSFPELAIFPRIADTAVTGAIAVMKGQQPSTDGAIVYLNCDGQLDAVLKRAQTNGGQLLEEVAQLPGNMGFIAQIRDLDGNRVGLHAAF